MWMSRFDGWQKPAVVQKDSASLIGDFNELRRMRADADEKISALTERNGHLEADVQVSRTNIEKRVEDLNSALQRERMERAVVEGALEAARKDNSRLQSEVGALRSTLRRGAPLEEMQAPPPAEVETDADVVDQDEEKPTRAKAKQS